MADALVDAHNNKSARKWGILELLEKQTEAKQNKFWKFYDAHVTICPETGKWIYNAKVGA